MSLSDSIIRFGKSSRAAFVRAWEPRWPRKESAARGVASELAPQLPKILADRIEVLRLRHRRAALIRGISLALGFASVCVVTQGFIDWWFGLSWFVRAVLLVLDVGFLAWVYRVFIYPPLRVRLNAVDMARLIEHQWPELGQRLLTATELAEGNGYSTSGSPQLAARVLAEATQRAAPLNISSTVPLSRIFLAGGVAGFLIIASLVIAIIAGDATAGLLQRMVLLNPPRPTKTLVVPVTRNFFVAKGDPVTLKAQSRRLHPDHGRVELSLLDEAASGYALETEETEARLFSVTVPSAQASFRYRFILDDGRGEEFTVTVKDPPTFADLQLKAIYPAYTRLAPEILDPTAVKILAGSYLSIRATASTRLRSATLVRHGLPENLPATLDATGTIITADLPIPVKNLEGWSLHLVDEDGVTSRHETLHPIEVVLDKPPKLEWVWPRSKSLTLTLRAQPEWKVKASDDYGLSSLTVHYFQLPDDAGETDRLPLPPMKEFFNLAPVPKDEMYRMPLDFSVSPAIWDVGRVIEYWAEAVDENDVTGPGVTVTSHRRMLIISAEDKIAELYTRSRRQAATLDGLATRHARATTETEEALRRDDPPAVIPEP